MRNLKKLTVILPIVAFTFFASPNAKSAEECFEGVSRAIFKFNMTLDDIILEPLAKGYNKLPSPIRAGTNNAINNLSGKNIVLDNFFIFITLFGNLLLFLIILLTKKRIIILKSAIAYLFVRVVDIGINLVYH